MRHRILKKIRLRATDRDIEMKEGQTVAFPMEVALQLINQGKITPVEKVDYRIYSNILQAYLWVVVSDKEAQGLIDRGITEVIYTWDEIKELMGAEKELLKMVHQTKAEFRGSKVLQKVDK